MGESCRPVPFHIRPRADLEQVCSAMPPSLEHLTCDFENEPWHDLAEWDLFAKPAGLRELCITIDTQRWGFPGPRYVTAHLTRRLAEKGRPCSVIVTSRQDNVDDRQPSGEPPWADIYLQSPIAPVFLPQSRLEWQAALRGGRSGASPCRLALWSSGLLAAGAPPSQPSARLSVTNRRWTRAAATGPTASSRICRRGTRSWATASRASSARRPQRPS